MRKISILTINWKIQVLLLLSLSTPRKKPSRARKLAVSILKQSVMFYIQVQCRLGHRYGQGHHHDVAFYHCIFFLGLNHCYILSTRSRNHRACEIYRKSKSCKRRSYRSWVRKKSEWNSINVLALSYYSFLLRFRYLV
jgi:hypothetical protein